MNMGNISVHHLNPQQMAIIAAEQTLYAVVYTVQWSLPQAHGEDKFIITMGI